MENNVGERIYKLLLKLNRNAKNSDLHSFQANIKNGVVWVECRGYEVFIETITYDKDGNEMRTQWAGNVMAGSNRLEKFGIDISSIEI